MSEQAAEIDTSDYMLVNGLPPLDGRYSFNLVAMVNPGFPDSLSNREGHELKRMSGVRIGELQDALAAGDNDVLVAFAVLILRRHNKRFDEERLWDAPMGSAIGWDFAHRREEEAEEENPPAEEPLVTSGRSASSEKSKPSGG